MAIKKISQFTAGTPTASDKILFEQDGAGKSTTVENLGKTIIKNEKEEIGINLDLLWRNASPNSNFSSQSIYLDLSNYKFVYIVLGFANHTSENTYPCLIKRGNEVRMPLFGSASFYYRPIGVRDNSIAFGDCEEVTIYNDTHTISNTGCIPLEIYGVK